MPYKQVGKTVYVKKRGSWRKKATAKTTSAAKRMISLLRRVKARGKKKGKAKK